MLLRERSWLKAIFNLKVVLNLRGYNLKQGTTIITMTATEFFQHPLGTEGSEQCVLTHPMAFNNIHFIQKIRGGGCWRVKKRMIL